jgi:hypothetical protein
MDIKNVVWNEVTGLSQFIAVVMFVGVFALGFFLGRTYEYRAFINAQTAVEERTGGTGGLELPAAKP